MKFHDDSNKLNVSIFVIICFLVANCKNEFISDKNAKNIEKFSSFLEISEKNNLSSEESKKGMSEDMQYQNFFDIHADFAQVNLDVQNNIFEMSGSFFNLEKNTIRFDDPFTIKMIFTPLRKITGIGLLDIIVFDKFEVLFDNNILHKNIFGMKDMEKSNKIMDILDKLRMRYGIGYDNCRYIFTNDLLGMKNIDIQKTTINTFNQIQNLNNIYSVVMNIFCFRTVDKVISFNSNFAKNYDSFLDSLRANHLLFFNKHLINNMRIIFKNVIVSINPFDRPEEIFNMEKNNIMGLQQLNNFSNIDTTNIKYAFLHFTKDGVLLSEESGNRLENVLFSFNYNSIRDCVVEIVPKQVVLPKQMLLTESNKCCIKMKIDMKDVFDNVLFVCSFRHSGYQCNLEAKFLQESLISRCSLKLNLNIGYAFENNINMSTYLMGFSSFSNTYTFAKIYEFINAKLKEMRHMPIEKRLIYENKLVRMIQELGESFKNFLQVNSTADILTILQKIPGGIITIPTEIVPVEHIVVSHPGEIHNPFHAPNPLMPFMSVVPNPQPSILEMTPFISGSIGGIFKLCENHPKMKDCLCAAYPTSLICKDEYCLLHPNFYECSPMYCAAKPHDLEACKCKYQPDDMECKCKLNPISKECFCMKQPQAKYCLPNFCSSFNNSNQIFCVCKTNPLAPECKPSYCFENKYDVRCRCLLNPENKKCLCYIYPSHFKCKNFNYESDSEEHEEINETIRVRKEKKENKKRNLKKKIEKNNQKLKDEEFEVSGNLKNFTKKKNEPEEIEINNEKIKDFEKKNVKKEEEIKSDNLNDFKLNFNKKIEQLEEKLTKLNNLKLQELKKEKENEERLNQIKNYSTKKENVESEIIKNLTHFNKTQNISKEHEKKMDSLMSYKPNTDYELNEENMKKYNKSSDIPPIKIIDTNIKGDSDYFIEQANDSLEDDYEANKEFLDKFEKNKIDENENGNGIVNEDPAKNSLGSSNLDNTEKNMTSIVDSMNKEIKKQQRKIEENFSDMKNFNKKTNVNNEYEKGVTLMRRFNENTISSKIRRKSEKNLSFKVVEGEEFDTEVEENRAENESSEEESEICQDEDIFCKCKNHPRYRPCVCLAFPNAEICTKYFCKKKENIFKYECNPEDNCRIENKKHDVNCKCKINFDSDCICKLNPLSKECFCKNYPISHLCNMQNCSFEKESIFCKCRDPEIKKNSPICQDYYCRLNPNSPQCFCLINPEEKYCKCLNDPLNCKKSNILKSITAFKNHLSQVDLMRNAE